jgi:hypothetical protein
LGPCAGSQGTDEACGEKMAHTGAVGNRNNHGKYPKARPPGRPINPLLSVIGKYCEYLPLQ